MVSERNTLCSNSNWVLWAVLPYLELGTWTGQTSEMFISLISACYQPLAPLINPGKLSKSTDLTFQSFPFSSCSQRALVRVSTVLPAYVGPMKKKKTGGHLKWTVTESKVGPEEAEGVYSPVLALFKNCNQLKSFHIRSVTCPHSPPFPITT